MCPDAPNGCCCKAQAVGEAQTMPAHAPACHSRNTPPHSWPTLPRPPRLPARRRNGMPRPLWNHDLGPTFLEQVAALISLFNLLYQLFFLIAFTCDE